MSTSGSYNWQLTRHEIITTALDLTNISPLGRTPMPELEQACVRYLNMINQELHLRGIHLWAVTKNCNALYVSGTVQTTLTSGTAEYDFNPGILDVLEVCLRNSSGIDTLLTPLRREEYMQLSDKDTSGTPTSYLIEYNVDNSDTPSGKVIQGGLHITLYPVPNNSTDSLYYSAARKLADYDSSSDDADAPPRWTSLLVAGLAYKLSTRGNFTPQERAFFKAEYEEQILLCSKDDTERGPMRFSPRIDNAWSR